VLGLVVVLMLAIGCGSASAASPVLEFASSSPLPIGFSAQGGAVTAELQDFPWVVHCSGSSGKGAITGPRSTVSNYVFTGCKAANGGPGVSCKSADGDEGEIKTPQIAAELVWIDQAKSKVGMVLQPDGGIYMEFECDEEEVWAYGPFVSPVDPINQEVSSFTASLSHVGALQIPSGYEGPAGESIPAQPEGETETEIGTTGVGLSFTISTSVPLTVKAINAAEAAANQRAEEAAAAKKKREEDETVAKKRGEEETAKKRLEEETAKKGEEERAKAKARARQLSKALKSCRKADSKQQRVRCEHRAKKRFAVPHPSRRY
jgi:molecular chaperone DnaK (HSP70)